MDNEIRAFDMAYEMLYNMDVAGTMPFEVSVALMSYGERLMREHRDFLREFVKERGDMLTSDRELAAFAVAFG